MMGLIRELFPICRSITGPGLRQTLAILSESIPLEIREVPSGTQVLDWTVPDEWAVRDAFIARLDGTRVVDFAASNLHVVQYSRSVDAVMPTAELQQHLHSLPDHPEWIPYRTSYYSNSWGFCLSDRQRALLTDREYRVRIDATLHRGSMSYGELLLPGREDDEVLFSCHVCHPSLANDNLSGIAVSIALAQAVMALPERRFTYRFLFIPGTIGSIAWLAANDGVVPRVKHALVLTCLGDRGGFTYKRSRRGDAEIDRYMEHLLQHQPEPYRLLRFSPYGYDERQYCSPGFDMPAGCLMRSPNGTFPEYHTSADDLTFVAPEQLAAAVVLLRRLVGLIETGDIRYRSLNPKGEPQLGRRGLYAGIGGKSEASRMPILWALNLADGQHTLFDVAVRAELPFEAIVEAADALSSAALLERLPGTGERGLRVI